MVDGERYEAERLTRAALGEFSYGGDPVPDLLNAATMLVPPGPLWHTCERLVLQYQLDKFKRAEDLEGQIRWLRDVLHRAEKEAAGG